MLCTVGTVHRRQGSLPRRHSATRLTSRRCSRSLERRTPTTSRGRPTPTRASSTPSLWTSTRIRRIHPAFQRLNACECEKEKHYFKLIYFILRVCACKNKTDNKDDKWKALNPNWVENASLNSCNRIVLSFCKIPASHHFRNLFRYKVQCCLVLASLRNEVAQVNRVAEIESM